MGQRLQNLIDRPATTAFYYPVRVIRNWTQITEITAVFDE